MVATEPMDITEENQFRQATEETQTESTAETPGNDGEQPEPENSVEPRIPRSLKVTESDGGQKWEQNRPYKV